MRNILKALFLGFAMVICSCEFAENIYINEDGSGKMEFSFDGSALMEIAGDDIANDSSEKIDSTISFKELMEEQKDSIAQLPKEDQEILKKLEDFNMHVKMDPEINQMLFDINTEFKNVSKLTNMMEAMNHLSKLSEGEANNNVESNSPMDGLTNGDFTEMNYSYENNVFKRITVITDQEGYENAMLNIGDMESMFSSSNYTLNYYFPKKIKSVSNENAVISDDGKSFTLTYDFMNYMKDPESMNLEIILED